VVRVELKQLVREIVKEEKQHRPAILRARSNHHVRESRGTYKGDSYAKKSARLRVWEIVQRALGNEVFSWGPHVFLTSHEGGDAATLRGLGVPISALIGVDVDASALAQFEAKYPGVVTRNSDVGHVLSEMKTAPASVFLDFSSQVSNHTLNKVRTALRVLKPGGVLACTFAIGREKTWSGRGLRPCEERLQIVEEAVRQELGYKPKVLTRLRYSSEALTGEGWSLMFVIVLQVIQGKDPESAKLYELNIQDLYRDVYRHRNNPNLRLLINCPENKAESLRARVKSYPPPRVT
jgi:hypothetical protein